LSDYPRRRRLDPEPPKRGGGMPIVPLVILVILAGLLLGGLLTKLFGNTGAAHAPSPAPSFTPLPQESASAAAAPTDTPSPTPAPSPKHKASPKPAASHAASPAASASPAPSPSASPSATPSAKPAEKPAPSPTPKKTPQRTPPPVIILTPSATPTPRPVTPAPSPTPAATATPVLITGASTREHAAAIVRAYINALAHGEPATATGYLANGIPTESFLNPNVAVSITNLGAEPNGDGSYEITAQIQTSKGNYLETFTVKPGPYGLQITSHNPTRM
jgi:hypothetical protein